MTNHNSAKPVGVMLKPGRERSVMMGNPWVFSGAAAAVRGESSPGAVCDIFAADETFLARGYINNQSKILCRILSRSQDQIDHAFIVARFREASELRKHLPETGTDAYRLVNAEGDYLPGLIIDRYGEGLAVQFLTAGMERLRDDVLKAIDDVFAPSFIVERSDTAARSEEQLPMRSGLIMGEVPSPLVIRENGLRFRVDPLQGQKTGFYLDQRDARQLARTYAGGRRVLNLFSYTGGFSVAAAAGGAAGVVSVDSSAPALDILKGNMSLNGYDDLPGNAVRADVFEYLNATHDQWDMILLDPPAFAQKKTSVDRAARGYKDINLRAIRRLAPGGVLMTFSCSHHIDVTLFRQIVFAAAADSGKRLQVIGRTGHGIDHPVNICHKEGEYLKGLVLRMPG
jgi:23S rRNA (cytosine1962-C5)-methyltransferase